MRRESAPEIELRRSRSCQYAVLRYGDEQMESEDLSQKLLVVLFPKVSGNVEIYRAAEAITLFGD